MKNLIKIFYKDTWGKLPKEIHLRKLKNGYLIGDTFVKDEEDLSDYIVLILKDCEANIPTPIYEKILEN